LKNVPAQRLPSVSSLSFPQFSSLFISLVISVFFGVANIPNRRPDGDEQLPKGTNKCL
jgi:hypothetical protein